MKRSKAQRVVVWVSAPFRGLDGTRGRRLPLPAGQEVLVELEPERRPEKEKIDA